MIILTKFIGDVEYRNSLSSLVLIISIVNIGLTPIVLNLLIIFDGSSTLTSSGMNDFK